MTKNTTKNTNELYIICSGDNSGNIETLDYRCPKKGIKKGDCRLDGKTCEYFMGIKNDRFNFDLMRMKGYCEYILNTIKYEGEIRYE